MTDKNPYRTLHARMSPPGAAWDEGFAAGRAAATPDPPEGETLALHLRVHPDTWCVLRRDESVPVGRLRVDVSPSAAATPDPPNECPECGTELPPRYVHEASGWFCGGCARPVARVAAASPDERLREAAGALVVAAACAVCEPGPFHDNDDHLQWKLADAITATRAALAAADRSRCGPVAPADGLYLVRVDYAAK